MARRTILVCVITAFVLTTLPTFAPGMRSLTSRMRDRTRSGEETDTRNPYDSQARGRENSSAEDLYADMPVSSGVGTMTRQGSPIADPNAVKARVAAFADLASALEAVSRRSTPEVSQWLNSQKEDNRIMQIRSAYRQAATELLLVRSLAEKDGAAKTVAAIDGILLEREVRYQKLIRTIQKTEALAERNDTDVRGRGDTRGRYDRNSRYGNRRGGYNTGRRRR